MSCEHGPAFAARAASKNASAAALKHEERANTHGLISRSVVDMIVNSIDMAFSSPFGPADRRTRRHKRIFRFVVTNA